MDPSTRELITAQQFGTAVAILALLALLGAIVFAVLGWKRPSTAMFRGALVSLAGVAVYPLWLVYNSIEDHFGLDSVAALLLNLALFAVLGVAAGLIYRQVSKTHRRDAENAEGN